MDKIAFFLLVLISGVLLSAREAPARNRQPNIIFIFIDDMGYGDLSSYGNPHIRTPNMDRLAEEGIRFTNFYVASPICSPSRVGIMTGQYPFRWGIHSYLASRKKNRQRGMADFLDPEAPTIAGTLQRAGYATAHFGKWHIGGGRDVGEAPLPQAYGFDRSLVSFEGLGDRLLEKGDGLSDASAKLGRGKLIRVEKWQKTGIYVDSTLAFIHRHREEPFYIELFPNDVHDDHIPKPEWLEKFGRFANDHYQQEFLAVLWNLDRQIGRVLDALDSLGLTENTLVVLSSDNGPTDWPFYYKEFYWPPGSPGPFRGRKWSLYEGGIREPFLVRWPARVPAGAVDSTTIIHALDLFPSLCALAVITAEEVEFDGQDLSQAILGTPQEREGPLFWDYGRNDFYIDPGNPRFQSPNLAVREGKWKLLINADSTDLELYDLQRDHAETTNLKEEYPEITRRLARKVLSWRKSMP